MAGKGPVTNQFCSVPPCSLGLVHRDTQFPGLYRASPSASSEFLPTPHGCPAVRSRCASPLVRSAQVGTQQVLQTIRAGEGERLKLLEGQVVEERRERQELRARLEKEETGRS